MGAVDSDGSDAVVELKGSRAAMTPTTPSSRVRSNPVATSQSAVLGGRKATPGKSVLSVFVYYVYKYKSEMLCG